MAAAYASRYYNLSYTIVLLRTANPGVINKLLSMGAKVKIYGAHWGEADSYLRETVIKSLHTSVYPVYCPPFDDPLLWDGHGIIVNEIVNDHQLSQEECEMVKGIVCSVGGGCLYNGIVTGLHRNPELRSVPILGVETFQTSTFSEAIKAGRVVTLDSIKTLVNCLASPYVSAKSLDNYKIHKTHVQMIDDLEVVKGSIDFYDNFRKLIEPACGATISMAFDNILHL